MDSIATDWNSIENWDLQVVVRKIKISLKNVYKTFLADRFSSQTEHILSLSSTLGTSEYLNGRISKLFIANFGISGFIPSILGLLKKWSQYFIKNGEQNYLLTKILVLKTIKKLANVWVEDKLSNKLLVVVPLPKEQVAILRQRPNRYKRFTTI